MPVHQVHPDVLALYLTPWLGSEPQLYADDVTKAIADARQCHSYRRMTVEQSLIADALRAAAAEPDEHAGRLAWATKAVDDLRAGRLPRDPYGDDQPSGYTYHGIPATWGDLNALYGEDIAR